MNVLILGYGRMGISHSTVLSGLLGASNANFYVVDPSILHRAIALNILKKVSVYKSLDKLPDINFDISLICTPPISREEQYSKIKKISRNVFIEKPVFPVIMNDKDMSGYVMQYSPVMNILPKSNVRNKISCLVEVKSNLNFSELKGWRSGKYGSIVSEFLGHALTFAYSAIKKIYDKEELIKTYKVLDVNKNSLQLYIFTDNCEIKVILIGDSDVRKTEYYCNIESLDEKFYITPYGYTSESDRVSIADHPISVEYFIRGFEFSTQMKRLLSFDYDFLSSNIINNIEKIIDEVNNG